jgi:hypothetical protein
MACRTSLFLESRLYTRTMHQDRCVDVSGVADVAAHTRAILRLAGCMEPDAVALASWFSDDPIVRLGGHTAKDLVDQGHAWEVLRFLHDVRRGDVGGVMDGHTR